MFCPNCGNKVKDGSLFCGECGTSLKEYWEDMAPDGGEQESFDGFSQADDLDDISVKMSETAGLSDPEDEIPADRIRVKLTKESEPDPSYGRQEPFYENDRQSIYGNDTRSVYGNSTQSVYENQSQSYGDNSRNYGGNPQGQPYGNGNAGQPYGGQSPSYGQETPDYITRSEPKKPVNKKIFVVIGEIAAGVALIAGGIAIMNSKFSAEAAVKNYWEAKATCDWPAVYDSCEFPDSEMLSLQEFVNAHADDNTRIDYKSVMYNSQNLSSGSLVPDDSQMIDWMTDVANSVQRDDMETVYVSYTEKGDSSSQTEKVVAVKTGEKKFLFWNEWKVIPSDYVVQNIELYVPNGTMVTLNGQDVRSMAQEVSDDGEDQLTIPYLFAGTYQFEVSQDDMEPYRALLDIEYSDDYFYSADLVPAQETVDALKEQAAEDMQTIFNNILNGLGYDSVQNLFVNGVGDGNCQEDYEYALQNFQEANLISFTLDQMTVQLDSADSDTITFEVDFHYSQTYYNGYENAVDEGTDWGYLTYQRDSSGAWKLLTSPVG